MSLVSISKVLIFMLFPCVSLLVGQSWVITFSGRSNRDKFRVPTQAPLLYVGMFMLLSLFCCGCCV